MKQIRIAVLVACITSISSGVWAADTPQQPKTGANFEQHKTEILKRIDTRIARNQEERACIQAAVNRDAIKVCRDKFKQEMQEQHQKH